MGRIFEVENTPTSAKSLVIALSWNVDIYWKKSNMEPNS